MAQQRPSGTYQVRDTSSRPCVGTLIKQCRIIARTTGDGCFIKYENDAFQISARKKVAVQRAQLFMEQAEKVFWRQQREYQARKKQPQQPKPARAPDNNNHFSALEVEEPAEQKVEETKPAEQKVDEPLKRKQQRSREQQPIVVLTGGKSIAERYAEIRRARNAPPSTTPAQNEEWVRITPLPTDFPLLTTSSSDEETKKKKTVWGKDLTNIRAPPEIKTLPLPLPLPMPTPLEEEHEEEPLVDWWGDEEEDDYTYTQRWADAM